MEEKALKEVSYIERAASMQKMLEIYVSHSTPVDEKGKKALESIDKAQYAEVDPSRMNLPTKK